MPNEVGALRRNVGASQLESLRAFGLNEGEGFWDGWILASLQQQAVPVRAVEVPSSNAGSYSE